MQKAQGALEYLIIIAVVISITAVITLISVNYFGGQQQEYHYASCQQAASTCKISKSINQNNPCTVCDNACNYTNGTEIFPDAITCCKLGMPQEIYPSSTGDNCDYIPPSQECGNDVIEPGEDCEGDNTGTCLGASATCDACSCYCSDGTLAGECSGNQPKLCTTLGSLVDDCEECGCLYGTCQTDGTCYVEPECTTEGCIVDQPPYACVSGSIVPSCSSPYPCGCPDIRYSYYCCCSRYERGTCTTTYSCQADETCTSATSQSGCVSCDLLGGILCSRGMCFV
jgi:hypothetical protein